MKTTLISWLLHLYPKAWRKEYGTELADMLLARPLTAGVFTYNPKLPAYEIANLRVGVRRSHWDIAFFVNNVFDELALLSFDQERGTRARVGFLTNQPRTFGISTRLDF